VNSLDNKKFDIGNSLKNCRIKIIYLQVSLILGVIFIVGCTSTQQTTVDVEKPLIELDELNRLVFNGAITSEATERVFNLYDESEEKPDLLLISSAGGSIEAAMDLAEWLLIHEMHIEVGSGCFSSCANYVFLAGRTKRLSVNSILGWHGSAWQKSFDHLSDPESDEYNPIFEEHREREADFFSQIGVDNLITVYGQGIRVGIRHWLRYLTGGGKLQGYDYSLADLKRFGVNDIVLLDGEWNWRVHHKDFAPKVRRVSLDEDYEFKLNRFGTSSEGIRN